MLPELSAGKLDARYAKSVTARCVTLLTNYDDHFLPDQRKHI